VGAGDAYEGGYPTSLPRGTIPMGSLYSRAVGPERGKELFPGARWERPWFGGREKEKISCLSASSGSPVEFVGRCMGAAELQPRAMGPEAACYGGMCRCYSRCPPAARVVRPSTACCASRLAGVDLRRGWELVREGVWHFQGRWHPLVACSRARCP
jgi:hypothetical protein